MRHLLLALLVLAFAASAYGATPTYTNTTTLSVTATDLDGDTLTYTWTKVSGPGTVTFGANNGTTTANNCTATVSQVGTYSFQVMVSDGRGGNTPDTVTNVVWTNRPTATSQSLALNEDASPLAVTLAGVDLDGTISGTGFAVVTQPTKGTISTGTGASRTYTPNANANGSDSFQFTVTDNNGVISLPTTVNITINPVNDAPVNSALPTIAGTVRVGQNLTASNGTWSDVDDSVASLVYAYQWQVADDSNGTVNLTNVAGATSVNYTIPKAYNGKYLRVRVTATDGGGGTASPLSVPASAAFVLIRSGKGDFTGEGTINLTDMIEVKQRMGLTSSSPTYDARADFDDSNSIGLTDMIEVKSRMGTSYP